MKKRKRTVEAERAFLDKMEGGCQVPIAGFAVEKDNGLVSLTALVASPDGKVIYKEMVEGADPERLGMMLPNRYSELGGKELIDRVKEELDQ